jgi:hypothetical protein
LKYIETRSVAPLGRVTGLTPALNALETVLANVHAANATLYNLLGTAGLSFLKWYENDFSRFVIDLLQLFIYFSCIYFYFLFFSKECCVVVWFVVQPLHFQTMHGVQVKLWQIFCSVSFWHWIFFRFIF